MSDGARPRILIVEDEWLIADLLEAMLDELGYDAVGPASSVQEALELIQEQAVDAALLDVSLGRVRSYPVAEALMRAGTPFLFLTGYIDGDLPAQFRSAPVLCKPVSLVELKAPLEQLVLTDARARSEKTSTDVSLSR
ncbi:MAG TPA: response regulator [Caulobacteraceae bacterium]|jgi:DNA-binding response OmpR family regulator|nr:response regulator [Caulobacteraceae bacterium]